MPRTDSCRSSVKPGKPGRQPVIPRWRGFNLTEMAEGRRGTAFREADFIWMAEWGFDFVRLPLSYWCWSDRNDWFYIVEEELEPVDRAIEWGRRFGLHINLNLHRIPGYCVNGGDLEPDRLFTRSAESRRRALEAAAYHWRFLAHRYRGIRSEHLSFDLLNEPPFLRDRRDRGAYLEVIEHLVKSIREVDPDRLIFVDGADLGQAPVEEVADLGLVQSTRGYLPKMVSHYTADWVPPEEFESVEPPAWPMRDASGVVWDRGRLRAELIDRWQPLVARGVPVHVGEWGCFNTTPHAVALAWMEDLLTLWREAGWGWALWNFRGPFGVLDSGRRDVDYEDFRGHRLDRRMLELLQRY